MKSSAEFTRTACGRQNGERERPEKLKTNLSRPRWLLGRRGLSGGSPSMTDHGENTDSRDGDGDIADVENVCGQSQTWLPALTALSTTTIATMGRASMAHAGQCLGDHREVFASSASDEAEDRGTRSIALSRLGLRYRAGSINQHRTYLGASRGRGAKWITPPRWLRFQAAGKVTAGYPARWA